MAATQSLGKAALLAFSLFAVLNLQGTEAQSTNCTSNDTPGWGIAILVLTAILLAMALLSCCIAPMLCGGGSSCGQCGSCCSCSDCCEGGMSLGKSC